MRTSLFTLMAAITLFNLTSCSSDAPPKPEPDTEIEAPSNLLAHTVLNDEVSEAPVKTQVQLDILVEPSEANEENIRTLLNYLYYQTSSRTGFQYHTNPTNIYIYAYTSEAKAKAGMAQWIGMLSKNQGDRNPSISISDIQLKSLNESDAEKWGLTSAQRHEIWDKSIHIEDEANRQLNIKYPDQVNDHEKRNALWERLTTEAETELAKEYGVEKAIVDSISREGLLNGWAFPQ